MMFRKNDKNIKRWAIMPLISKIVVLLQAKVHFI